MKRKATTRGVAVLVLAAAALATLPAHAQTSYTYVPVTPCRAVDTRTGYGGIMNSGVQRNFQIRGVCGVAANAVAVTLNLTVVTPSYQGWLAAWPSDAPYPGISNINFNPAESALANGAVIKLGAGSPDLATLPVVTTPPGTVHLVLDVTGYYK